MSTKLGEDHNTVLDSNFDPASATASPISLAANTSDDSIDLGALIYSISKSISSTSLSATSASSVAVGEVISYDLTLALQPGDNTNTVIIDTLPAGLQYVASSASLIPASASVSASLPSVSTNANQVTFNLGTVHVSSGASQSQRGLTLRFQALVRNVPGNSGLSDSQTVLANSATLQVASGLVVSSNSVNATVVEPRLQISKNFSALYTRPGDTVSVILQVTNTGTAPAYGVVVADPMSDSEFRSIQAVSVPLGFTFSAISNNGITTAQFTADSTTVIPDGGSLTFTFQAVPKETLEPGVTLHNTATVTTYATLPSQDLNRRIEQPVSASADLLTSYTDMAIVKTDTPDPVHAGGLLTYTLTVQNNGPYDAHQITVTDVLPAGLTFVSTGKDDTHDWACTYSKNTQKIECTLAGLANTDSTTITITARPASNLTGKINNTATVSSIMPDPDPGNNQSTAQTTLDAEVDLSIVKTAKSDHAYTGSGLSYVLTIANDGPSTAVDLIVNDILPDGLTVNKITAPGWACTILGQVLSCTRPLLADGDSSQITIDGMVAKLFSGKTMTNTATVASATNEVKNGNNSSTIQTTILPAPLLTGAKLVKDVNGDGIITPGELLEYTVTITNDGISDAFGVIFNDTPDINTSLVVGSVKTVPGSVTRGNTVGDNEIVIDLGTIAAKGGSATITFRVKIASPLPAGVHQVSNQGTITGTNFQPVMTDNHTNPNNPGDPTITIVTGTPQLSALKASRLLLDPDHTIVAGPGDTLEYTITITNSGDAAESAVRFTDTPDPNSSLSVGTVVASQGTVTMGNNQGDKSILVDIGTLAGAGGQVTITFQVTIHNPLPGGTRWIQNQGQVKGQATDILTDDPKTDKTGDQTSTPVIGPTAVTLLYFHADPLTQGQIAVRWATAAEINTYGFKIKRAAVDDFAAAVDVGFIPASVQPGSGGVYEWIDQPSTEGRWVYWLVEVDNNGNEVRYEQVATASLNPGIHIYLPAITR